MGARQNHDIAEIIKHAEEPEGPPVARGGERVGGRSAREGGTPTRLDGTQGVVRLRLAVCAQG